MEILSFYMGLSCIFLVLMLVLNKIAMWIWPNQKKLLWEELEEKNRTTAHVVNMFEHREREKMAQVIAHIISGVEDAVPLQDDFDLADRVIALVESELKADDAMRRTYGRKYE